MKKSLYLLSDIMIICQKICSAYILYKKLLAGKRIDIRQVRNCVATFAYNKTKPTTLIYMMYYACRFNSMPIVIWLTEQGIHMNDDDIGIRHCYRYGHIALVKYFLSISSNPYQQMAHNVPWACEGGHITVLKLLISLGYHDVVNRPHLQIPTVIACMNQDLRLLKFLVKHGYDPVPAIPTARFRGSDLLEYLMRDKRCQKHQIDEYENQIRDLENQVNQSNAQIAVLRGKIKELHQHFG